MDFPNLRKQTTGVGNPLYVSDIVNANQNVLDAMKSILGLGDSDFYIISGMEYGSGAYTTGIVYMSGIFYFSNVSLTEGKYLAPSPTDYLSEPFEDTVSRYIYTINYAVASNTPVSGGSPIAFSGDMNDYRINNKTIVNSLADYAKPVALADQNGWDYTMSNFTLDGNTHALDISSKIPVTAKYVILDISIQSNSTLGSCYFFKYGNTYYYTGVRPQVLSQEFDTQIIVPVDSNRKINYRGSNLYFLFVKINGYM
jgi:hypothetical protein